MATKRTKLDGACQQGFSFIELMASLAILTLVIGVVVQGVTTMQTRNTVETNKLDLTQESRQFMDQIVNDLHQSGFPRIGMFDPATLASATACESDNNVACGLVSVSQSGVQFEGDVDATGVSEVFIQLVQTNGANAPACTTPPCVMQRGTISKVLCAPSATGVCGTAPQYFTEVNNVMNTNIFSAFLKDGTLVTLPASASDLPNIKAIGITLYVRASQPDPQTGLLPTVTMVSTAELKD